MYAGITVVGCVFPFSVSYICFLSKRMSYMTLTCAIIDDEPLAVSLLESYVEKTPFLQPAGKYTSAVQALAELTARPVDLLFLDINGTNW